MTVPGVIGTPHKGYVCADEIMDTLGISKSKAYQIIRALRQELIDSGKITAEYPVGKVPRKYYIERCMME